MKLEKFYPRADRIVPTCKLTSSIIYLQLGGLKSYFLIGKDGRMPLKEAVIRSVCIKILNLMDVEFKYFLVLVVIPFIANSSVTLRKSFNDSCST